jgi:hypothetical protein
MALYKDDYIRPATAIGAHLTREALEAATVTHPRGCPLVYSSGYVAAATSAAVVDVIGVSEVDGGNDAVAGTSVMAYVPIELCPVWRGKLHAVTGTTEIEQTDLGTAYGLAYDGTAEVWYVDKDEATAGHKSVTVVFLEDAVGTTDGWVHFVFNELGDANDGQV